MCDCKNESYAAQGMQGAAQAETASAAEGLLQAKAYSNSSRINSYDAEIRGENNVRKQVIADHASEFKKQIDKLPYGIFKDIAKIKIDEAEFWALKSFDAPRK